MTFAPLRNNRSLPAKGWTFHVLTFGCKVNQYESQALREAWQALGGTEVQDAAQATVTVVNSCAITARAVRESRNALHRLVRENPAGIRILTGCSALLVQQHEGTLPPHSSAADPLWHLCVPAVQKYRLLEGPLSQSLVSQGPLVQEADSGTGQDPESSAPVYPPFAIRSYHRARPVVKVQDGCSHRCTYCIVPLTRGPACSRDPQAVVDEAQALLEAGHREIMLSGINLAQYAAPVASAQKDFWALLRLLERALAPRWAGRARFRISSLEPGQLHGEGLETLAMCTMLCPHVHISLQSGSPAVLRRMGRGHYSPEALVEALQRLGQHWPRMGLGADILMGFPGEEPAHVAETLAIVEALPLTYAHVFPYSRRPGTPAADFPRQVLQQEKLRRSATVRAAVQHKHQAFVQELLRVPHSRLILDGTDSSKGVNEYYVQCHLHTPLPGRVGAPLQDILTVRPLGVQDDALLVEYCDSPGQSARNG